MKQLLVLAALVVATHAFGKWTEGLKVRFGIGLGVGSDFFISVPETLSEAKNARWVQSTRPTGQPRSNLVLYNPSQDDVILGAFYDSSNNVAGLQIALPQDSYTDAYYDWTGQGFKEWTTTTSSGASRTFWTTAVYFVSENSNRSPDREGRLFAEDQIYVTAFNGELMPISIVASEVTDTAKTHFTQQACIPFMGRHYYYNMSSTTECTTETILPWFPLVDESSASNQLIGLGFMNAGKLPESALVKDYFERPGESAVRMIVNSGPECLYEITKQYSVLTMHIYFVNTPLLINCLF